MASLEFEYKGKKWLFKDRLKERMKDLGIKHDTEVYGPQSININQRTFRKYKYGESYPGGDVVFKLARRLQCTSDYLMGLEEDPTHEGTDVAEYTGLSSQTIEQLHQLASHNDKENDSFRYCLDFIEFMMRDDEFRIHDRTFDPEEKTVATIIKEAADSFNTYYRCKLSGKMDMDKNKLDFHRKYLSDYGIKTLYRKEMLEYYQQLLSRRLSKITDEWLEALFTAARQVQEGIITDEMNRKENDHASKDEEA